jgi:hypothetical protein
MNGKLQKVIDVHFCQSKYSRQGSGTNMLTLACGHRKYQKSSIPVPARARCDCARRNAGLSK